MGAAASAEVPDVVPKLFNKWACEEVNVSDMSLQDYIPVKEKSAKYLPHSSGRYAAKRFRKALCPIVERLVNSLMMHGRNNGKKLMTVRIVKHSFEIIYLLSGENPLQVLVNAIINSGPREDSTRQSGFCALVPVKPASETSNPLLNVLLMNSSTLPREVPTPTLSRRRTNLNVSPNLTDKMLNAFYCMNE